MQLESINLVQARGFPRPDGALVLVTGEPGGTMGVL